MSMSKAEAKAIQQRVSKALAKFEGIPERKIPYYFRGKLSEDDWSSYHYSLQQELLEAKQELEAIKEMVDITLGEES